MSSNPKILLAGFGLTFGLGALVSYFLARLDVPSQPPNPAIAAEFRKEKTVDIRTVKPVKSPRELLEEKYRLCVGNNGDISKVPDSVLTQVIQRACTEKS
jgi:hypothetical protein